MKSPSPNDMRMEDGFFLALVILVSVAFAFLIRPFFAAILWAVVAAILFAPLNDRLRAWMRGGRNRAASLTLLLIVLLVIVPAIILAIALIQEGAVVYGHIQSGEIDFARIFDQFRASLPGWATGLLDRSGLTNLDAVQEMLDGSLRASFRTLAGQALQIGQGAFSFLVALSVMLYLTFFMLRDGESLSRRVSEAAPLRLQARQALVQQFVVVVRATIKGSIVVAIVQGFIGGVVFWLLGIPGALLWGVMMAFFSLLPAIGTGLVWAPVALYLIVSGALVKAAILIFSGLFVIGLVDNLLRPALVGRETRIPDYVVLISTLGGIELFGFSGLIVGPMIAALFISVWNIAALMRVPPPEPAAAGVPRRRKGTSPEQGDLP
ncbi:MAG TPA: AI-2E family transporter [Sphingobium sp.]|nr:AI-2E family transporter [Sphingobium sp.]